MNINRERGLPNWRGRAAPAIRPWIVAALWCATATPAVGDASLRFRLTAIEGDGWRAGDLVVGLRRDDTGRLAAVFNAGRIELPAPVGTLSNVSGTCEDLVITAQRFRCKALSIMPAERALTFTGRLDYERDSGAIDWRLETMGDPPGRMEFSGRLAAARWTLRLEGRDWPLAGVAAAAQLLGQAWPTLDGLLSFSIAATGEGAALPSVVFSVEGRKIGGANAAGTLAAAGLGIELRGSAWPESAALAFDARARVTDGELYAEPLYAELATYPLQATLRGVADARRVDLKTLLIEQAEVLHIAAEADVQREPGGPWRMRAGRLQLVEARLPGAYDILLQPFLGTTPLGDLETAGLLRGELTIEDHRPATLGVELVAVHLDDRAGRLAMYDLSGRLDWARWTPNGPPSDRAIDLDWSGGFLGGIPFGPAQVELHGGENDWTLGSVVSIPLLDGALEIDTFQVAAPLDGAPAILFDARLTPVDMRELSRALDWPPLSGHLSGRLPGLSYRDGTLTLGGAFTADIFDGIVEIRDLRVERIFQAPSRLTAEIELRDLALGELSEALSFGSMTGRVEGHVHGLELIDWRPVAFDALLQTPAGDRSARRISQRAVDNIASLGGGGSGLSTGFLGLFEEFSYDAFALGCRLEGDVCEMSGLEPRENGYTILRGRGLPRIDVVGFAHRVNWTTLAEQIAAIIASEGPEVR